MTIRPRTFWILSRDSVLSWLDDYAPSMGAALSYYTLFSVAPLLLLVISVAGMVFGQDAARGEIIGQLRGLMGEEGATAIQAMLESANKPTEGALATVISLGVLIVGATTVFGELQSSLDRIWMAPARVRPSGIWGLLRTRLLSFGLILGIGFLLMVSLVASAALAALGKWWSQYLGEWVTVAQVLNILVSFAFTVVVFAAIYKWIPSVRVSWRDILVGAVVTSLLFSIGRFLIGMYLGRAAVGSAFGAAGSMVVFLVWVYYSAQIFLLGAEFTWVYSHTLGSRRTLPLETVAGESTAGDIPHAVHGHATA